ncbi:MAG TPA: hypothetical protein VFI23_04580 [Rhizomicrobium sp.]|nr:hypothetical protein [Rhizomicrobium sp.]
MSPASDVTLPRRRRRCGAARPAKGKARRNATLQENQTLTAQHGLQHKTALLRLLLQHEVQQEIFLKRLDSKIAI